MREKETGLSFTRENSSVRGRREAVRFGHVRVTISDGTPLLPSYLMNLTPVEQISPTVSSPARASASV
jgi:hypothetical protein